MARNAASLNSQAVGQHVTATPSLSDQDQLPLQLDSAGNLLVNVVAGGGSGSNAAAGQTGVAVPADADYQGVNVAGNLTGVTGKSLNAGAVIAPTVAIVDGSGNQITTFGGGTQFADNAASGTTPTGTLSMGWDSGNSKVRALKVDASQNLDVNVNVALPAGTNVIGHVIVDSGAITANIGTTNGLALDASVTGLQVAQASTTSGQKGSLTQGAVTTNAPTYTTAQTDPLSLDTSGNLRVSLKDSPANTNKFLVTADPITFASAQAVTQSGAWTVQPGNTANTTPWLVQSVPATSGGLGAPFSASQTSTKGVVKASAGTLYGYEIVNNGSALCYIQVFNKLTANVTVGTTAPDWVIPVPAPSSGTAGAGIVHELDKGYSFGTGLVIACTTTRTGSTSATCDVNFFFD